MLDPLAHEVVLPVVVVEHVVPGEVQILVLEVVPPVTGVDVLGGGVVLVVPPVTGCDKVLDVTGGV